MKNFTTMIATTTLVMAGCFAAPAFSQGAKQTVTLTQVDPLTLATGYRSTKVVGSDVYNDTSEKIGEIDDLIITTKESVPYVVLSVGGFLGMGKHYVVVPASALTVANNRMVLAGGTKDSLKALPGYEYAK